MLMRCVNEAMRTDPQAQNTRRFEWWLEQVLKDLWADGLVAHLEGANLREQDLRHCVLSPGYHCDPKQPLPFAALASQKNYMSVYLCSLYQRPSEEGWVRERFAAAGKKLDMGKSCIRFKRLEDLPLDVVGEAVARFSVADYISQYEAQLAASQSRKKK